MFRLSFTLPFRCSLSDRKVFVHGQCPRQCGKSARGCSNHLSTRTCTKKMLLQCDEPARPVLSRGTRVVVSGGTGFIGRTLIKRLVEHSAIITVLARDHVAAKNALRGSGVVVIAYDSAEPGPLDIDVVEALDNADAVVNLAGEPIAQGRWTSQRKNTLWDSRIVGTAKLARSLVKSKKFRGVFISASAVGYYGTSQTERLSERSRPGTDFLAKLALAWETAALRYTRTASNIRTVIIRFGVVLGPDGGALQKMIPAFRAFLGGAAGSGQQWFSWVHRDDVVDMIIHSVMTSEWSGTYNCVAPNPVRLKQFCDELARVLHRTNWLQVPAFAIKALLGSEAADLILAGQHVLPERALKEQFRFRFTVVGDALEHVLEQETKLTSI